MTDLTHRPMPKAYELPAPGEPFDPELFRLGAPCKRNHIHADGMTLRCLPRRGRCLLCERIDAQARSASRRATDPDFVERQRAYALHNQRRLRQELRYKLLQRSASKARKIKLRTPLPDVYPSPLQQPTPSQLLTRWGHFGHRCAYCDATGKLEIEHVVPISKGGLHHISNIVPACHACNSSKRSQDAEHWFKRQSFYRASGWALIEHVLDKSAAPAQLSLLT